MPNLPELDIARYCLHARHDIVDEPFLLCCGQQAKQIAGLGIVVVTETMVVTTCVTVDAERWLQKACVLYGATKTVRFVVRGSATVAIEAHMAIAVIGVYRAAWPVDR